MHTFRKPCKWTSGSGRVIVLRWILVLAPMKSVSADKLSDCHHFRCYHQKTSTRLPVREPDCLPLRPSVRPSVEWRPKFRQEIESRCKRKGRLHDFQFPPIAGNYKLRLNGGRETLITKIRQAYRRVILYYQGRVVSKFDSVEACVQDLQRDHTHKLSSSSRLITRDL